MHKASSLLQRGLNKKIDSTLMQFPDGTQASDSLASMFTSWLYDLSPTNPCCKFRLHSNTLNFNEL